MDPASDQIRGARGVILLEFNLPEIRALLQPLGIVSANPDPNLVPCQFRPAVDLGGIATGNEQGVAVPEYRNSKVDDLDPLRRHVHVAGQQVKAATLQARYHGFPWALDELMLGDARSFKRGQDEIRVPACSPARGVRIIDWESFYQSEADAVLGITRIGAVAADIIGRI